MTAPQYIQPGGGKASIPQLSAEDLVGLTPGEINQARRNGQMQNLLNPQKTTEPLAAHMWDRMTQHDRAEMVRTYGPAIDPTNTDHEGATS